MAKQNFKEIKQTKDPQSPLFRQNVAEKLTIAVKKVDGLKNFGTSQLQTRIASLAYNMGITSDPKVRCKLKDFTSRIPNADSAHLQELDRVLDSAIRGAKTVRKFGARNL
ncbi:MAG: hypothetical protein WC717_05655 [Candidatus Micrarchaeia archaeon]|jgi:hypothetical protein